MAMGRHGAHVQDGRVGDLAPVVLFILVRMARKNLSVSPEGTAMVSVFVEGAADVLSGTLLLTSSPPVMY